MTQIGQLKLLLLPTLRFMLFLLAVHTVSCISKIRIGLPFWYQLTRVVPDKEPLNGCVCVCVLPTLRFMLFLLAVVSNDLHLIAVNSFVNISFQRQLLCVR